MHREKPGYFKRFLASSLTAVALLSSPLLDQRAMAQPQVETQTPQTVQYDQRGTEVTLSDSGTDIRARAVISSQPAEQNPAVVLEGPAMVRLKFYPLLARQTDAGASRRDYTIRYSVDSTAGEHSASTEQSTITSSQIDMTTAAIGTSVEFTVDVPEGRHTISVTYPSGFLEVVGATRPAQEPRPIAPEPPIQPQQRPEVPAQPAQTDTELRARPYFTLDFQRMPVHAVAGNSGDVNEVDLVGGIRLHRNVYLLLGADFTTIGMRLERPSFTNELRGFSPRGLAGLSFDWDRSELYALAYVGYQAMVTDIALTDGRTLSNRGDMVVGGGRLGYDYDNFVGAYIAGGSDPFNPFSARAYGRLPFWWGEKIYPELAVDYRWLHVLREIQVPGYQGVAALNDNAHMVRTALTVPIWRVGDVFVPSLWGGYQANIHSSGTSHDGFLGAQLGLDFPSFYLNAGGAYAFESQAPVITLNLGARR